MSKEFVVGSTPVLIANADDQFLATCAQREMVKFVTKTLASPLPDVDAPGHILLTGVAEESISRDAGLVGYVFAQALYGATVSLILENSTVTPGG
jgi:hypothetical protein